MTIEIRYSVMSPEAETVRVDGEAAQQPVLTLAGRPESLENKTLYLVDTGFGGSYKFMLQLQQWFAAHMPSVTTIRRRKPGNVFLDDNRELWNEIKARGHAVVLGVAG